MTSDGISGDGAKPTSTHKRRNEIDRPFSFSIFAVVVAAVLLCDQVTKVLIRNSINPGQHIPFIPHVLDFTLLYNSGAAFGMMAGALFYFVGIACAFVGIIIIYLAKRKRNTVFDVVALSFVAGGALGNMLDRLFQSGKVTDFVEFLFVTFPIFNLADACVTIGTILFVIAFIVHPQEDIADKPLGKHSKDSLAASQSPLPLSSGADIQADTPQHHDVAVPSKTVPNEQADTGPAIGSASLATDAGSDEPPAESAVIRSRDTDASVDREPAENSDYWYNPLREMEKTAHPARTGDGRSRR
jgi:signal peptidase II